MKQLYYILFLFVIFTAYLFSQIEENKLIKKDTVIVIKVDTVLVAELVNIVAESINNCKETSVVSAKAGVGILAATLSATWDVPIGCNTNFVSKCFYGLSIPKLDISRSNMPSFHFVNFGLGVGSVVKKTDNVIIKYNICPTLQFIKGQNMKLGLNLGTDIMFKVFEPIYFSVSPDLFVPVNPDLFNQRYGFLTLSFGISIKDF
jgi:hypothetical protein